MHGRFTIHGVDDQFFRQGVRLDRVDEDRRRDYQQHARFVIWSIGSYPLI